MTERCRAQVAWKARITLMAGCVMAGAALAGCASLGQFGQTVKQTFTPSGELTPQQRVQITENRLTAAGFKAVSPQTPDEVRRYSKLPPTQLTYRIGVNGKLTYYYADPTYCLCYFAGDDEAYQRYQGQKLETKQARRAQHTERLNDTQVQMQQNQLMGPFGIDSPLGGNGPGSSFYSY